MSDSIIGLTEPGSPNKKLDSEQLVVGANTVQRERVQVAGATDVAIAGVLNAAPAGTEYALVVRQTGAIPAGTNNVGDVDILSIAAGDTNIGNVDIVTQPARSHTTDSIRIGDGTDLALVSVGGALLVDGSAVTQPVSGTATANQGTPAVTANRWPVQITDGTDLALVSAAGAVLVDGSAVTQPVSGTVTTVQATAASLNAEVQGDAAHNAALSGNPVRTGARASAGQLAAVTDGNTTDLVADRHGRLHVRSGAQSPAAAVFTNVNFPAVNTRASSTRAAGAAGVRHVITGLTASLAAGATAPAAVQLDVRVRDGILDTGTILWQMVISLPATAGAMNGVARSGLWIPGTAATAMTIEFSAAGGANTFESVSMELVDITE